MLVYLASFTFHYLHAILAFQLLNFSEDMREYDTGIKRLIFFLCSIGICLCILGF